MKQFSDKRFVDIGQTLFTSWIKDFPPGAENDSNDENVKQFKRIAEIAFDAAGAFAQVFAGQEKSDE